MEFQKSGTSPATILRLSEVLRRTGFSRSTLYNRISKNEFPHQISLGGRAIGWLEREVSDWIGQRIRFRPGLTTEISEDEVGSAIVIPVNAQEGRIHTQKPSEPIRCVLAVNEGSPDLAQLHQVNTKLYFDRSTGSFWIKLIAEEPTCRQRNPRGRS
jgi:prophage regulatory protein